MSADGRFSRLSAICLNPWFLCYHIFRKSFHGQLPQTYNLNSGNVGTFFFIWIKWKLKDFQITWASILFTIEHREHNRCLDYIRLDYCNALLGGFPTSSINKLQIVQNAAARVLTRSRKYDHISPILQSLHWLSIKFRISYKILLLTYKGPKWFSSCVLN